MTCITGVVSRIGKKEGIGKDDKPYQIFSIVINDIKMNTFHKPECIEGDTVTVEYHTDKFWNGLDNLRLIPNVAGSVEDLKPITPAPKELTVIEKAELLLKNHLGHDSLMKQCYTDAYKTVQDIMKAQDGIPDIAKMFPNVHSVAQAYFSVRARPDFYALNDRNKSI